MAVDCVGSYCTCGSLSPAGEINSNQSRPVVCQYTNPLYFSAALRDGFWRSLFLGRHVDFKRQRPDDDVPPGDRSRNLRVRVRICHRDGTAPHAIRFRHLVGRLASFKNHPSAIPDWPHGIRWTSFSLVVPHNDSRFDRKRSEAKGSSDGPETCVKKPPATLIDP